MKNRITKTLVIFFTIQLFFSNNFFQKYITHQDIPKIYNHIYADSVGKLYVLKDNIRIYEKPTPAYLLLNQAIANIIGTDKGISLDFRKESLAGTLYAGFIPYGDSKHPIPVYVRNEYIVKAGKSFISIANDFKGDRDFVQWKSGKPFTIGYRLIDDKGIMLYDGKITLVYTNDHFNKLSTVIEGPLVTNITSTSATISYTTDMPIKTSLQLMQFGKNKLTINDQFATIKHELVVNGLSDKSTYNYTIEGARNIPYYNFTTSPLPGSRTNFTFSYASDSRIGGGGGERNLYGANFYIMKKMRALNKYRNIAFSQFTGDLQGGYLAEPDEANLMFTNWKRAIEPYAAYFPVDVTMGNHETLTYNFNGNGNNFSIDKFPFDSLSAEKIFADNFVMPTNGPESEDGASFDPSTSEINFPSYKENVFYYTYDNVAMIVLNTNYFYAPTNKQIPYTGGGLHGYIMDMQLKWLKSTLQKLEADKNIDHIFISNLTPFFPNGGHVSDDMWYNGNNSMRSSVAGIPMVKGIIERRDELLDLLINKSKKVRASFCGDEHNYCKTIIGPNTNMYPPNWDKSKLLLSRSILQITNGSAGAPYYAQEQTPWTPFTSGLTTQNALVFVNVQNKKILVDIINPDTLELIEKYELK